MSKQQLYINGVAVDMPTEEIKVKVASNVLADADKVKTAHSYNVALPRTMTNDNVFALAYLPQANTAGVATHTYLTASLYVDGIPLFSEGKAVLTSVDDKGYNLTLLWGIIDVLDKIKAEDLNLCDLPKSVYWNEATMAAWSVLPQIDSIWTYESGMDATIYNTLDSDSKALADTKPWVMTCVTAGAILLKLQQVYGLQLDLSPAFVTRRNLIAHPLTTLKAMCDDEMLYFMLNATQYSSGGHWSIGLGTFTQTGGFTNYATNPLPGAQYASNAHIANDIFRPNGNVDALFALTEAHVVRMRVHGSSALCPHVIINAREDLSDYSVYGTYNAGTGLYDIDHEWTNITFRYNYAAFTIQSTTFPTTEPSGVNIQVEIDIDKLGEVRIGDYWEKVRNYPNVGIIDYLTELLAHCGAYIVGSIGKADRLRIVTYDEVLAATPQLLDIQGVGEIAMAVDDFAQENIYIHADNDDGGALQPYTASGKVIVYDTTLKAERDAFKSEFKVPKGTFVELWRVDGQKAEWSANGDYIGGEVEPNKFGNNGQDFESVLGGYYGGYRSMMAHPKRITITTRLSVLELLNFSFERPVYIKQTGRTYLVESVENEQGDDYKLTLIQI